MPELVEFVASATDMSAMLRAAADRVDAGEYPDLQFIAAVFVNHDTTFRAYGWGKMSLLEAHGALALAVAKGLVSD